VHWFRLHAFVDLRLQRERVLFTYRRAPEAVPLLRVQRESLVERFPLRAPGRARAWRAAVAAMVRRGHGCALFLLHDDTASPADDDDLAWLLAQHAGPRAELLADGGPDRALAAALARHGTACERAVPLS
jgi:hypothetical protein